MKSWSVPVVCGIIWSLAVIAAAGKPTQIPLDPQQEELYLQFRAAAQSKDAARLRALSHSKSKACVDAGNAADYDRITAGMIRVFGHDQKVKAVGFKPTDAAEFESAAERMSKRGMRWPVIPAGRIIVRYEKAAGARAANLHVAKDHRRWRWVHICRD